MLSDDEEKQYVTPEQGRKEFPTGVAIWTYCAQCGAPLLLPEHAAPFCNGRDIAGCGERSRRGN